MAQTTKQFNAFLRLLITSLKAAMNESDPEKKNALLQELIDELQIMIGS